jgi:hypothetical protein
MKTPMTFRLAVDLANYLRSRDNQAETIESAVRRSYGFKSWTQAMEAKASVGAKKKTGRISRDPKLRGGNQGRKGN